MGELIWILSVSFVAAFFGFSMAESKYDKAIEYCQKPLPRTRNCKLVAIPSDYYIQTDSSGNISGISTKKP